MRKIRLFNALDGNIPVCVGVSQSRKWGFIEIIEHRKCLMILIRGIRGEFYAQKIEKGIVDCRDILSALLQPPVTGYEYSDYYEKNLVKALTYFTNEDVRNLRNPQFLLKK